MSEIDDYADPEAYMDDLEEDCDYGFEFCINPNLKAMCLCTTECDGYLEAVEETVKRAGI